VGSGDLPRDREKKWMLIGVEFQAVFEVVKSVFQVGMKPEIGEADAV
jgi:hypothetical protein